MKKFDILLAGVGGQGVLSMAAIIARAAIADGWNAKQSEVHGMAQRGGAVIAHLRLSTEPIASDLIPHGSADMVLSLEPVESLRYVKFLAPTGSVVTTVNAFANIPDYPDMDRVVIQLHMLPRTITIDAESLALAAGDVQTLNTVMVGAASKLLPFTPESLQRAIRQTFGGKGDRVLEMNLKAFEAGRQAAL